MDAVELVSSHESSTELRPLTKHFAFSDAQAATERQTNQLEQFGKQTECHSAVIGLFLYKNLLLFSFHVERSTAIGAPIFTHRPGRSNGGGQMVD